MSSTGEKTAPKKSDPLVMPVDLLVRLCAQDTTKVALRRQPRLPESYIQRLKREHEKVIGNAFDGGKKYPNRIIKPKATTILKLEMPQILQTRQIREQKWTPASLSEAALFEDINPRENIPEKAEQVNHPDRQEIQPPATDETQDHTADIIDLNSHKANAFQPDETLIALADTLAGILHPDHTALELSVDRIKASDTAVTYKIFLGIKSALVKIFAPGDVALAEFKREKRALEGFHGNLVPRLLFVAEAERLIMTEFIAGETLSHAIAKGTLLRTAEHLGQWIGQLYNIAPHQPYKGNWAGYLDEYAAGLNPDVLAQQASILQKTRIIHLTLAHNDNALSNYVLGSDNNMYGLDFSDARFKPEGWDLAMATRALFLKHPNELPRLSAAMLQGYQRSVRTSNLPDNFDQIMNIIAIANMVATS